MIYNPYFSSIDCALQPAGRRADESPLSGLLSRLGQLDGETLLLLGLLVLLWKDGKDRQLFPLLCVILYLLI